MLCWTGDTLEGTNIPQEHILKLWWMKLPFAFLCVLSYIPSFFFTESGLEFLRRLPQFISMRRMVQQNPQSLPVLLQQLGQENPELLGVQ